MAKILSLKILFLAVCIFVTGGAASAQYCSQGTVDQDSCGCSCGGDLQFNGWDCYCPNATCPGLATSGHASGSNTCECSCFAGGNGDLYCGWSGLTYDAAHCTCNCPAGQTFSSSTWTCGCPPGGGGCNTSAGEMQDSNSCGCVCNSSAGYTGSAGACTCADSNRVPGYGRCICNPAIQCNSGQILDQNDCTCGCQAGLEANCVGSGGTFDPSNCGCKSCSDGKVSDGQGGCKCASDYNHAVENQSSDCNVTCKFGSTPSGVCKCSGGMSCLVGGTCTMCPM